MINPIQFQLNKNRLKKGFYESFYFRGNHQNGTQSFWLKHNLLMFANDPHVRIESTLITFDKESNLSKTYNHQEDITLEDYQNKIVLNKKDWEDFSFNFKNNSSILIQPNQLQGKFNTNEDSISWNLKLNPSNKSYYHFSNDWFYHGFFPKKKILTKDIHLEYSGTIETPHLKLEGSFIGMNGHNWGTEHAYKYAYGNCNQFDNCQESYFDGFSGKITLMKGVIKSPYLSCCSLKTKGKWYHFNNILKSYQHKVSEVSEKKWKVTFISQEHILEIDIDGSNQVWADLSYDHPSRKVSTVHNTKYAHGTLTLKKATNNEIITTLTSHYFELESLIP
jgi:hypothetical protein